MPSQPASNGRAHSAVYLAIGLAGTIYSYSCCTALHCNAMLTFTPSANQRNGEQFLLHAARRAPSCCVSSNKIPAPTRSIRAYEMKLFHHSICTVCRQAFAAFPAARFCSDTDALDTPTESFASCRVKSSRKAHAKATSFAR